MPNQSLKLNKQNTRAKHKFIGKRIKDKPMSQFKMLGL